MANQFAGAGVGAMGLDHHRAACRQRRCGVATRHGEGQREVTGAEHGHRPQRYLALAQVCAGQGLALRQRIIDAHIQPFPGAHGTGKGTQLLAGASALTEDTRAGQAGLADGAVNQFITYGFDLIGDGL